MTARPEQADPFSAGAAVVLSLEEIVIDDAAPGEELPEERVFVTTSDGGDARWSVQGQPDWLAVEPRGDHFAVRMVPHPGVNRAKLTVTDDAGRSPATLRVLVTLNAPASEPAPVRWAERTPQSGGLLEGRGLLILAALAGVLLLVVAAGAIGVTLFGGSDATVAVQGNATVGPGQGFATDGSLQGSVQPDRVAAEMYVAFEDGVPRLLANAPGQVGIIDLGAWGKTSLPGDEPPETGYQRNGVTATVGHAYVAQARSPGRYVVFKVTAAGADGVSFAYAVR